MTGPAAPTDLAKATTDIKRRAERVAVALEAIVHSTEPIFADPRAVMIELVLATHELEAAQHAMRRSWWP
jgi:hypothetical protein